MPTTPMPIGDLDFPASGESTDAVCELWFVRSVAPTALSDLPIITSVVNTDAG
jgi:hypothetical protein